MADSLIFDPTSEFEVLETFDFEEEVQRPLELRFFTLDEQLIDFFEKHLPKGKPSKYDLEQIKDYQHRLRVSYERLIDVSESEYIANNIRKTVNVDWVHPVYAPFDYKSYSYTKEFAPLFDKTARVKPNYYPLLINSLPSPYVTKEEGRPLDGNLELVDETGKNIIKGLLKYQRTKTIYFDDGSFDIKNALIPNTVDDDLKIIGYFLDKRKEDIPNPLRDHPFLESTKESFVKTDITLNKIFPSISTIIEHAIPKTSDPYETGMKFLKIYDINLSNIEWSDWKRKFPPVDTINTSTIQQLIFPTTDQQVPSDILQKVYTKWFSGYHQRYWLSLQSDSGRFIQELLRSDSSKHGLLPPPSVEGPALEHPKGQREICMSLTQDFDSFLSSGIYRPIRDSKGFEIDGICVPVGSIQQEKAYAITKDRIGWKETTENDLQTNYTKLLANFQQNEIKQNINYEKFSKLAESELHQDVLNILSDEKRSSEDKADDIELIVRNGVLVGNIYTDVQSRFIVCLHTIKYLRLTEYREFFREWTDIRDGSRVCKYCGEAVTNEILVATDDYDDDGHLMISREVLTQTNVLNTSLNSILQLKNIFDLNNSGESVLYLLISILQVVPYEQQIIPILQLIRKITQSLKARASAGKKISKMDQERIEGILGICGMVILLQTHDPILVPKKTVGNKMFNSSGYPRDTSDPKNSPVLDSLIVVLKKTFESYYTELKGGIGVLASQLTKTNKLREEALVYLSVFASQYKLLLETAKDRYVIPQEIELNIITFPIISPIPSVTINEIPTDEMTLETVFPRTNWINKNVLTLTTPIKLERVPPSPNKQILNTIPPPSKLIPFSDKDVQKLVSVGLPSGFPILVEFIKDTNDFNSFSVILKRLLDLLSNTKLSQKFQTNIRTQLISIDYTETPSFLRDIVKGLLFSLLHEVKKDGLTRIVNEGLKNDLTLKIALLSKDKAEKEEFTLRTNETNLLKQRYREMSDTQREITKMLVDIGIADFIVTNEDRELFVKKSERNLELEYSELESEYDVNRPEEGYDNVRDYIENGDLPNNVIGNYMDVDRGDYGDRTVRDYNDYSENTVINDDEY